MEIKIFKTAAEATHFVAQEMHKTILEKAEASLGVATGRTMDAVYHSFVQLNKEHPLDFSKVKAGSEPESLFILDGAYSVQTDTKNNKILTLPGSPMENIGLIFGPRIRAKG